MTASRDDPVSRARAFIDAIVWGEHTTLWELLSDEGRMAVLSVAVANGLDRVAAGRLHDDLADPVEREDFLRQLLAGLRRDLRSVDLDHVNVEPALQPDGVAAVVGLSVPSDIPGTGPWSAGRVILSPGDRGWRVDRLEPRQATT